MTYSRTARTHPWLKTMSVQGYHTVPCLGMFITLNMTQARRHSWEVLSKTYQVGDVWFALSHLFCRPRNHPSLWHHEVSAVSVTASIALISWKLHRAFLLGTNGTHTPRPRQHGQLPRHLFPRPSASLGRILWPRCLDSRDSMGGGKAWNDLLSPVAYPFAMSDCPESFDFHLTSCDFTILAVCTSGSTRLGRLLYSLWSLQDFAVSQHHSFCPFSNPPPFGSFRQQELENLLPPCPP